METDGQMNAAKDSNTNLHQKNLIHTLTHYPFKISFKSSSFHLLFLDRSNIGGLQNMYLLIL